MPESNLAKSTEKYDVPRNRDIPETSMAELLASEPLAKTKEGKVEGSLMDLYEGRDSKLPRSALIPTGKMYAFKIGWLYVSDERMSEAAWLFEAAKMGAIIALPVIAEAAGAMSDFVEEIGKTLLVGEDADEPTSTKSVGTGVTVDEYIKMLAERGTVALPGVNLVEAEHQVDPGRLFTKERHRLIVTYEHPNGERKTYSLAFQTPNAKQIATGMIQMLFETRWWGEFSYLTGKVKSEQIDDIDALGLAVVGDYKTRYGDKFVDHLAELYDDFQKACDAELERKGFTASDAGAIILERLAPVIPYYEQVPTLNQGLNALRDLAAGKLNS